MSSDEPRGPGDAIRPRSSADTEGDVQRVLSKLEQRGFDLRVNRLVANSPNAFRPFILFADALVTRAMLPAVVREVVVLHLAVMRNSDYEWYEHRRMALSAGVTADQMKAIRTGRIGPELFSAEQLLGISIADELMGGQGLARQQWKAAIDAWAVEGAMDLVLSVGWWGGLVPLVLEALAVKPPPEA